MTGSFIYDAFISYSRADKRFAARLQSSLEGFPIAAVSHGAKRRFHLFRDQTDIRPSHDLGQRLRMEIDRSAYLVVVCSHDAARSEWVGKEIEHFLARAGGARIVLVFADRRSSDDAACVPPALRGRANWRRSVILDASDLAGSRLIAAVAAALAGLPQETVVRRARGRTFARAAGVLAALLIGAPLLVGVPLVVSELNRRGAALERARDAAGYERIRLAVDALPPPGALIGDFGNVARVDELLNNMSDRLMLASIAEALDPMQSQEVGSEIYSDWDAVTGNVREVRRAGGGSPFGGPPRPEDPPIVHSLWRVELRDTTTGEIAYEGEFEEPLGMASHPTWVPRQGRRVFFLASVFEGCTIRVLRLENGRAELERSIHPECPLNYGVTPSDNFLSDDGSRLALNASAEPFYMTRNACPVVRSLEGGRDKVIGCRGWISVRFDSELRRFAGIDENRRLRFIDLEANETSIDPTPLTCGYISCAVHWVSSEERLALVTTGADNAPYDLWLMGGGTPQRVTSAPEIASIIVSDDEGGARVFWIETAGGITDVRIASCLLADCARSVRRIFSFTQEASVWRVGAARYMVNLRSGDSVTQRAMIDPRLLEADVVEALRAFCGRAAPGVQQPMERGAPASDRNPCNRRGLLARRA